MNPKISIIIPVYNMGEYLEETISSWLNQGLKEIEIICVDDASTDNSLDVLNQLCEKDNRIKVYHFDSNKSAWSARILGINKAEGEYIMFADADDCILPNACEELFIEMKKNPVDILHFDTEIINVNNLPPERLKWLNSFLKPYDGTLKGRDILDYCFQKKKYGFNLWNKLYSATLCKKAFRGQADDFLPRGQDKLAYFILAFFAKTYRGIPGRKYYQYFYGRGGTGSFFMDLSQFERICSMKGVADKLHTFLEEENAVEDNIHIEENFKKELVWDCISKWSSSIADEDKAKGFDLLVRFWGQDDVIECLAKKYKKDTYEISKQLKGSEVIKWQKRDIKTIATYYYSIDNGGVARVMCALSRIWIQMGFNVIVITDSSPNENDYSLPRSVKRITLSDYESVTPDNFRGKAEALRKIISENYIDVVVYHEYVSSLMLWDELAVKCAGAAFIAHCHNVFSFPLIKPWTKFQEIVSPYILADAVVALSETDALFWNHFNKNTFEVNNPFLENIDEWKQSRCDTHDILWLGRIAYEKRPFDALEIFKMVLDAVPDAVLHVVGSSKESAYENEFKNRIKELHLEKNVVLHGFHLDVKPFYEKASVFLMTSAFEGYPLTLQEAMVAGLPVVMYDMPYLTMSKENRGLRIVRQEDRVSASAAIVDLLKNDNKRFTQGRESREYVEKFIDYDFIGKWKEIFGSLGRDTTPFETDRIMMETLVLHNDAGIDEYWEFTPYMGRKAIKYALKFVKAKDMINDHGLSFTIKRAFSKFRDKRKD